MLSLLIEAASFAVALAIALPCLWSVDNVPELILILLFVFCCGGAGARFSAMVREKKTVHSL